MAANKKLTGVIKGRTISGASQADNALTITFSDNSTIKIKTGGQTATDALKGKTVDSVQQQGTAMGLTFTDKSSQQIALAEATSSVMVRDGTGKMEYAD